MFNPPGNPFLPAHPLEDCHTNLTKVDFLHLIFIPKQTSWWNTCHWKVHMLFKSLHDTDWQYGCNVTKHLYCLHLWGILCKYKN